MLHKFHMREWALRKVSSEHEESNNDNVALAHFKAATIPKWSAFYLNLEGLLALVKYVSPFVDLAAVFVTVQVDAPGPPSPRRGGRARSPSSGVGQGMDHDDLNSSINRRIEEQSDAGASTLRGSGETMPLLYGTEVTPAAGQAQFLAMLSEGLTAVNRFYSSKSDELTSLFAELRVLGHGFSGARNRTQGRQVLKESYSQLYTTVVALRSFAAENYNAVNTALRTVKTAGEFEASPAAAFARRASSEMAEMLLDIARVYAAVFLGGDIAMAVRDLSARSSRRPRSWTNQFNLGFFSGFSIPLLVMVAAMLLGHAQPNYDAEAVIYPVLPVFRATGVVVLVFWLWGLAVFGMERFGINFGFIMQLNPETQLDHHRLFKTGALLSSFWLAFFVLYVAAVRRGFAIFTHVTPRYYPFLLVLSFVLLLILPVRRVLHGPTRLWLAARVLAVITAPFSHVFFSDILIGDYLTSLVKVLYDLEYLVCYYLSWNWYTDNYGPCTAENQKVALPILTALPYLCRLLQCLRRWRDTGDRWPHLGNAFKYLLAMVAVTWGAFHSAWSSNSHDWTASRVLWLITLVSATIIAYLWDICMDWGLIWIDRHTWRIETRRVFLYGHGWAYIIPAVLNLAGRFVWSLTIITYPVQGLVNHQLAVLMYTVIEVVRRTGWAMLRIESEAAMNQTRFSKHVVSECVDPSNVTTSLRATFDDPGMLTETGVPALQSARRTHGGQNGALGQATTSHAVLVVASREAPARPPPVSSAVETAAPEPAEAPRSPRSRFAAAPRAPSQLAGMVADASVLGGPASSSNSEYSADI